MKKALIMTLAIVFLVSLIAGAYPSVSEWRWLVPDNDGNAVFIVEGGTSAGQPPCRLLALPIDEQPDLGR